eukprot:6467211-Pyramimonas_sp.AAC.1
MRRCAIPDRRALLEGWLPEGSHLVSVLRCQSAASSASARGVAAAAALALPRVRRPSTSDCCSLAWSSCPSLPLNPPHHAL